MRIGVDATPLSVPRAGVGTYTANLLRALAESREDDIVPFLHREVHPSFADELNGMHVPAHDGSLRLIRSVWMQTSLRRRIRRGNFDLCHFPNGVAPLGCPSRYVVTIHDVGLWLHPEHHYLRRLVSMRPLIPHAARGADAVVTVSHAVKEEILDLLGLPEPRVRVIHQGVSPHFEWTPEPDDLSRARSQYRLPERFILSVGTLEPRKNLVRLIKAYTTLIQEPDGRDLGLVIVGPDGWKSGPLEEALSELAPEVAVSLLGAVPNEDLVCLYHLAAVLAFPSLYEGFGLPVVEAMTCGTPVVTSRAGALAEIAGDAAELVDPGRTESIAEGLFRVVSNEARAAELRQRGLARATQFSWSRAALETRALYAEIVGATAPVSRDSRSAPEPERPHPADSGTTPRPSGIREREASPGLEEAILRSTAYADVFDYPLTRQEIHRYLVGVRATYAEVCEALEHGRLVSHYLERHGELFTLRGREAIIETRRRRAAAAGALWPDAIRFGSVLARVPFVRMVAVTGSLAARNVTRGADIDYLVVTETGRLWLCRALVILVVRAAARRGVVLCPNYFLSESALALEERDLYTAWELAQAVPVAGHETYRRWRSENRWTETLLPNAGELPLPSGAHDSSRGRRSRLPEVVEAVLRTPIGGGLERWERERKVRRFTSMNETDSGSDPPTRREAEFGPDRCKGHFGKQASEVLDGYRARVAAVGL